MKLYIKQDVFAAYEHFSVKDENGMDQYDVRSGREKVRVGLKLHIYDADGNEAAYIDQKALSFQPTFRVYRNGRQTATIAKKFSLGKPKYEIKELDWIIKGDFLAHEYSIIKDGRTIMKISKEWMTWGDSFVLELFDEDHIPEALAVVLAIDCVVDAEGNGIRVNGHGIEDIF